MRKYSPQLISAIFLVAGTAIGGGMLALPVSTAQSGFFPSLVVMGFAWIAATLSALYFVEVGFWMKKSDAHVISMAETFLGRFGKIASWILYLFICYASLVAYTAGCGHMTAQILEKAFSISVSKTVGCFLFILAFGPVIMMRHKILGRINSVLFIGMILAYIVLIFLGSQAIKGELLFRSDWKMGYLALPILLTAFSFQTMVPSLHPYLQHHAPSLRIAIIAGTTIAFIVYCLWQAVVLGTVPLEGDKSLLTALEHGEAATQYLGSHSNMPLLEGAAGFFAFLALVTSFLGISLGLFDFLSDGLHIPKVGLGDIALSAIIIIPTLFFAVSYERVFIEALDLSGGFGDTFLTGMIPISMVWIGRYRMKKSNPNFHVAGGRALLIGSFAFYALVLVIETLIRAHIL